MQMFYAHIVWEGYDNFYFMEKVGDLGYASKLGKYDEYSGGPNEEEVLQCYKYDSHSNFYIYLFCFYTLWKQFYVISPGTLPQLILMVQLLKFKMSNYFWFNLLCSSLSYM